MPDSQSPAKPVDHYEFWWVKDRPISKPITVRGQFDEDDRSVQTEAVRLLGNPVEKTLDEHDAEKQIMPDVHLVAYRLALMGPPMTRPVEVTNQLGAAPVKWVVTNQPPDPKNFPLLLLLPAWKKLKDHIAPPPRGPQFVCYPVREAPPIQRKVRLVDQFSDQEVHMLTPRYLGVPVKTNFQPMWNDVEHLAIYEYSSNVEPSAAAAWTRDALQKWDALEIRKSVMLGVPSTKKLL